MGSGLPSWLSGKKKKKPSCQCRRCKSNPWVGKSPWKRKWQPTPVFLPGKSHGQRSQAGYSPWGCKRVGHDLAIKQYRGLPFLGSASLLWGFCVGTEDGSFPCWQASPRLGVKELDSNVTLSQQDLNKLYHLSKAHWLFWQVRALH